MMGRKMMLPMLNVVVGAALGLVALKVVALYLGRETYGQVEAALAILGLVYLFADLSLSDAHIKRVSEGVHPGDCFVTFALVRGATSLAFILASVGGYLLYTQVLGRTIEDTTVAALLFAMLYYVAKSAQNVVQSTFEAKLEAARSQLGTFLENVVRVALTVLFVFVFAAIARDVGPLVGRVAPEAALWRWVAADPAGALAFAYFAAAVVATAITTYYMIRSLERGRFRWELVQSYFAFALPLFAGTAMGLVAVYVDRAVLAFFGTSVDTADFAGPRRIVSVLEGVGFAVGVLLFPMISALAARGDRDGIRVALDRTTRYLSILLLPLVAFLIAFPGPVIRLVLGNEWLDAGPVLMLLAAWVYIVTLTRPQVNLLVGHGHTAAAARIGVAVGIVNLVLNLVLIPDDIKAIGLDLPGLKAVGAAIATLVAGIVQYVLLRRATVRLVGAVPDSRARLHLVASVAMCAALVGIDRLSPLALGPWWTFPIYTLAGGIVYFAALVALREFTREDWAYVKDTLHLGEMGRYLRSELGRPPP